MSEILARARSVLIDANLLLLLVAGSLDSSLVGTGRHRRLLEFDPQDLELLDKALDGKRKLLTTPHILSEVSNLVRQVDEPLKTNLTVQLGHLIERLDERYAEATFLAGAPAFPRFGLTDAAISELAAEAGCVLTMDAPLYQWVLGMGFPAVNFNHLRDLAWRDD